MGEKDAPTQSGLLLYLEEMHRLRQRANPVVWVVVGRAEALVEEEHATWQRHPPVVRDVGGWAWRTYSRVIGSSRCMAEEGEADDPIVEEGKCYNIRYRSLRWAISL